MEWDEDNLNWFVWYEMKGWLMFYLSEWFGVYGCGFLKFGLEFDVEVEIEEDDFWDDK